MTDDFDGAFGVILGVVVSALRKTGHSIESIHRLVDVANESHEVMAKTANPGEDQ